MRFSALAKAFCHGLGSVLEIWPPPERLDHWRLAMDATGAPAQEVAMGLKRERVRIILDEAAIAHADSWAIIEPVWWCGAIYGSHERYEAILADFSRGQRLLYAIRWYVAEISNGGHRQFYQNPTGIVWQDALAGFEEIGAPDAAAIVADSALRMGGCPSFSVEARQEFLSEERPDFADLDERFYALGDDFEAKMTAYVRQRPKEFVFDGMVERTVLPTFRK